VKADICQAAIRGFMVYAPDLMGSKKINLGILRQKMER
jgi:hypothetical protein